MDENMNPIYRQGYLAGYLDGLRDARTGANSVESTDEILSFPVKASPLSSRAQNCLLQYNCSTVADAIALEPRTIETMRNLGPKTAAEIAHWLDFLGISHSTWSRYWQR